MKQRKLYEKDKKLNKIGQLHCTDTEISNLNLIIVNQFKLTTDPKRRAIVFEFYNGDKLAPLTKQTGEFLASKISRDGYIGYMQ